MELYTKIGEDFIRFEMETFDKDFIKDKLILIDFKPENCYLDVEGIETITKMFAEFFEKVGSEVIATQGCNMNILVRSKPDKNSCMIFNGNKE